MPVSKQRKGFKANKARVMEQKLQQKKQQKRKMAQLMEGLNAQHAMLTDSEIQNQKE